MARTKEAATAYFAAAKEIERFLEFGGDSIDFDRREFRSLENIPPQIADIRGLSRVNLNMTSISNLTPLSALDRLQFLSIKGTAVTDISPLIGKRYLRFLHLGQTAVSDLSALQGINGIQHLSLDETQVSDISILAGLTKLRFLTLDKSKVEDLRPIRLVSQLAGSDVGGLRYLDTPATEMDGELAKLAAIRDSNQRTNQTLEYLKSLPLWPKPYLPAYRSDGKPPKAIGNVPLPPEQDPALPLIWGEKGFTFLANGIETDPVTEATLVDLRDLLEDLRRKGNRHDDLYRIASELQDRAKGEVRDLNMVRLHLSYQKLRRLYQSRTTRTEAFDDETVGVLGSVLETLPGVTMADPQVEILIKRQEADLRAGAVADTVKAEQAVLTAMQSEDAPFAPEVKDAAKDIAEPGQNDRLSATRGILTRNGLIAVFKYVGGAAVGGAIGGPVGNFLYENGAQYLALAQTLGADAYFWAQMVFTSFQAEYQTAMGIAKEVVGSGKIATPKRPK